MTYPIALVLTGRPAEAVEFVMRHVEDVASKPDLAPKFYAQYAVRFMERYAQMQRLSLEGER